MALPDIRANLIGVTSGRLLLCRHGQTEFNVMLKYQGQTDEPLNALGRGQAMDLGRRLASEHIHAAYSSDLSRARDTALAALGERALPLVQDARLREAAFGRWEGMTFFEIQQRWPDDLAKRQQDLVNFVVPEGESFRQVAQRCADFLEEVMPGHAGQTVLLVSHGGTLNMLLAVLLGFPLSIAGRFRNRNANLTVVNLTPNGPLLETFNQTGHLES